MPTKPLLATKLNIPPLRQKLVPRPHLIERLKEGLRLGHRLTLVSAPAGFGKTTLVSDWAAGWGWRESEIRVAWISLDEGDNDLTRFLSYIIAALQTTQANFLIIVSFVWNALTVWYAWRWVS